MLVLFCVFARVSEPGRCSRACLRYEESYELFNNVQFRQNYKMFGERAKENGRFNTEPQR